MKEVHDRERKRGGGGGIDPLAILRRVRVKFFSGEENFKLSSFSFSFNGVSFARGEWNRLSLERKKSEGGGGIDPLAILRRVHARCIAVPTTSSPSNGGG